MPRFSANLSTLFQDRPLAQRFAAAAQAGFDAVELWFPYDDMPAAAMREHLEVNGLHCVGINSSAGDVTAGDWGLASDPARRNLFDASVVQAFDYAREIGCPNVHVMAGLHVDPHSPERSWEAYLDGLGTACDLARDAGLTVMIEPLNAVDRPLYILQTQARALEAIRVLDRPNLKVMLDIFHLQRGEGNLIDRMTRSLPYAAHIQIADNPGRHEPGTGEINFATVFGAIQASGYLGYIGCEYFPSGRTEESFTWRQDRAL